MAELKAVYRVAVHKRIIESIINFGVYSDSIRNIMKIQNSK